MDDETRQTLIRELIGLAALAVGVLVMDQRVQITVKGWAAKVRAWHAAWQEGYQAGEHVAEWMVREQAPQVVAEAERITKGER